MLRTTPIPFQDFSGGITDNYIDAPINKYEKADNLLITENRKLFTRDGLAVYNTDYAQLPMGSQRVGKLIDVRDELFAQTGKKLYVDNGSLWLLIGDVLKDITVSNYISYTNFHKTLFVTSDNYSKPSKVFKDNLGNYQVITAGLPDLASSPSLVTVAGVNNYVYSFHYYYEYYVDDVLFVDAGPVTQVQALQIDTPDSSNVTINSIPELVNGANDQYDTANIKVKIYRTAANEDTFYLVDTINNGVTSYVDSLDDATLLNRETIYTTGGVLDNDPPPPSKYIHFAAGVMLYGNYKSGSFTYSNRVLQSVVNDPDSVPAANYIEFPEEVTGVSSYMDRLLVFCTNSLYRIDGNYDEFGTGGPIVQQISDTIGCVSSGSIVQTADGVMFASKTGFAFTDGFKCLTVSNDFNETYKLLTKTQDQKDKMAVTYDQRHNRVYFSVQDESSLNGENNKIYVCDMRWGVSPNMSFTTFSGENNRATALVFHNDEIVQGDYRGYVLAYREGNLSDVRIDVAEPAISWKQDTILYDFKSAAIKPYDSTRYFMPKVMFSAKNSSNLSLQISSDTDTGNRLRDMKPIRWRGNLVWGDPLFTWGSEDFRWGVQGFIEQQRYFHGDDLRGTYKQVQFTNAEVIIINSDSFSTVSTDGSADTAILDDLSLSWLDDMVSYKIAFEHDNYSEKFEILSSTASILNLLDTNGTLPTASGIKWQIYGKPKNEILSLIGFTLMSAPLGQTQEDFSPPQVGGNN